MPTRKEKVVGAQGALNHAAALSGSAIYGPRADVRVNETAQQVPQAGNPMGVALFLRAREKGHSADRVAHELGVTTGWLRQMCRNEAPGVVLTDELVQRFSRYLRLPVLAVHALAGRVGGRAGQEREAALCGEVERAVAYVRGDPAWRRRAEAVSLADGAAMLKLVRQYEQKTSRQLVTPEITASDYQQARQVYEQRCSALRTARRTVRSLHSPAPFGALN